MAQRFEGKNLDEALTMASEAFGVDRVQLTYHVVLEKKGFLGGFKRVVVEAEVNERPIAASVQEAAAPAPGAARRPGGGGGGGRGRGNRDRDRGRGRGGNGGDRGRRPGGGNRAPRRETADDFQTGDFERFAGEIPEQGPESEQAGVVRAWYARVIELAKLQLEIRTEENETQVIVRLFGGDARLLTEEHGELLDALQVLGNKAMTGRKVEKEIEQLGEKARELADRVRSSGREQLLPAMTPIERRIVHLALQEDADVTTESRGDGFYKRVAVVMRDAAE
jgi:predicted RNA-binding protein Jag